MKQYATVTDLTKKFRTLTTAEQTRADELLKDVSDILRQSAMNCGRDLDEMIADGRVLPSVVKSVVCDIVARTLLSSTTAEPMTQISQSVGGYSISGSPLSAGGGIFIKKQELARLGIKRQRVGVIDFAKHD